MSKEKLMSSFSDGRNRNMTRPASEDVPPSLPSSHVPSCVMFLAAGNENALSAALPTGTAIGANRSGTESKSGPSATTPPKPRPSPMPASCGVPRRIISHVKSSEAP